MNKKGTLMYLIFLGLLIAIGALFLLRDEIEIEIKVKGEWQVDFLKENYFEAQKDLLRIDIVAKNIGTEIAFTLANKGGFTQNSECGQTNDLNLWNNQQQWCLPTITENVITLSQEKFPSRLPNLIFSEYGFNENLFWGKGEKATIVSEQGTYIYDTSFAVNLGYSFEEYLTLQTRAQRLVSRCRNDNDLHTCLNQEKPDYWKYTSCTEEQFSEDNRKVPFCVQSPNLAVLPVGTFLTIPTPITYPFALDFTPTTTFSVESFTVTCEVESCEITMPRNDQAELYTVHFTNS
ncbi:hypothetical protein KKA95_02240, partial [Patescibacteria group bacterium]|nr:hypothetical protein [Patescibacteria group bacterium]